MLGCIFTPLLECFCCDRLSAPREIRDSVSMERWSQWSIGTSLPDNHNILILQAMGTTLALYQEEFRRKIFLIVISVPILLFSITMLTQQFIPFAAIASIGNPELLPKSSLYCCIDNNQCTTIISKLLPSFGQSNSNWTSSVSRPNKSSTFC